VIGSVVDESGRHSKRMDSSSPPQAVRLDGFLRRLLRPQESVSFLRDRYDNFSIQASHHIGNPNLRCTTPFYIWIDTQCNRIVVADGGAITQNSRGRHDHRRHPQVSICGPASPQLDRGRSTPPASRPSSTECNSVVFKAACSPLVTSEGQVRCARGATKIALS
jgi:hypothetical protein